MSRFLRFRFLRVEAGRQDAESNTTRSVRRKKRNRPRRRGPTKTVARAMGASHAPASQKRQRTSKLSRRDARCSPSLPAVPPCAPPVSLFLTGSGRFCPNTWLPEQRLRIPPITVGQCDGRGEKFDYVLKLSKDVKASLLQTLHSEVADPVERQTILQWTCIAQKWWWRTQDGLRSAATRHHP